MKFRILNGNILKIIACISMLLDHIGLIFFPYQPIFRILGRLALPIFAFMIAEGARYTKNRFRHFFVMFALAVIYQIVNYFFNNGSLYMCILITFSISTLLIYALQELKKSILNHYNIFAKLLWGLIFAGGVVATYFINQYVEIDYGFWGCTLAVFVSLFDFKDSENKLLQKLDSLFLRILCIIPPMIALILVYQEALPQIYSLISLPILLLYSGKRGTKKLKYCFYVFYPLHLAILYGINMFLV